MGFSTTRNLDAKLGLAGRCGLPDCLRELPSQTCKHLCLAPKLCRTGSVRKSTAPFLLRHAPFGAGVSQASADMPIRAKTAGPPGLDFFSSSHALTSSEDEDGETSRWRPGPGQSPSGHTCTLTRTRDDNPRAEGSSRVPAHARATASNRKQQTWDGAPARLRFP